MTTVVSNNSYIKSATEILISFNNNPRAGQLHIHYINSGDNIVTSCYTTSNAYTMSVRGLCSFSNGTISIGCSANTWGFTSIPVSIAANSIKYR